MTQANSKGAPDSNDDLAAKLIRALDHPLRVRILRALMSQDASASQLARDFGMPLSNLSYHLTTVLDEECGVISVVKVNQRRGGEERVFAIRPESCIGVIRWEMIPEPIRSGVRGLALSSFLSMAIAALEAEAEDPKTSHYAWRAVDVDEDGNREICEAMEKLIATVEAVVARCAGSDDTRLRRFIVASALFEAAPDLPNEST